jgi:D-serine deaminase-like pyridoxal phosphate-dependent protein
VDAVKLSDLPTPCLVLDRGVLARNIDRMAQAVGRLGVALRPHMKTAKSIDVARMVLANQAAPINGITVSTLAEAEYFAAHGITDILYAVGITPQKLDRVARLNADGAATTIVTDDAETASAIAAHPARLPTLIEIDCGEMRGGIAADDPALDDIADALGLSLRGIMTHAGHSYSGRSIPEMADIAEAERKAALFAAARLRDAGHECPVVSVGSSPTALHARALGGITETRPGVYMFGDLFQSEIETVEPGSIAVTVLASVIGRRPAEGRIVIDAGGMALSKDRATESAPHDYRFGLVLDAGGRRSLGRSLVARANQEHGVVDLDPTADPPPFRVGDRVRVAPNHTCMTSAAHDRYYVVDGSDEVVAVWPRINGW